MNKHLYHIRKIEKFSRKHTWFYTIKDFNCIIAYHPWKANVVADALSRKCFSVWSGGRITLLQEFRDCKAILSLRSVGNLADRFQVKPTFKEEVIRTQFGDPTLRKLVEEVRCEKWSYFAFRIDDILLRDCRLCVPNNQALKESLLEKSHISANAMHLSNTKMYRTWKAHYKWQVCKGK